MSVCSDISGPCVHKAPSFASSFPLMAPHYECGKAACGNLRRGGWIDATFFGGVFFVRLL